MFKIIQIDENNKNIVVLNTATNTKKTYKTTRELRTLYDKSPEQCENFKFDERGFRYMPKGQKKENLDVSDIREVKNKLDSVVSMLRQLNTQTNTNFQVLDKNTEQSVEKVLTEISVTMKKMLEVLDKKTDDIDKKIDNITNLLQDNNDKVYNEVKKLGMTFDEFEEKFEEITKELLDNTSTDNKFPKDNSIDSYKYYTKQNLFDITNLDDYKKLLSYEGELIHLDVLFDADNKPVNKIYLEILQRHLKQMNDASIAVENTFMTDVDTSKNERLSNTIGNLLVLGSSLLTFFSCFTVVDTSVAFIENIAANPFVISAITCIMATKNFLKSNITSYRETNGNGKVTNKVIQTQVLDEDNKKALLENGFIQELHIPVLDVVDTPVYYNDIELYNKYVAEIRNFRILTLSCHYKKRGFNSGIKNPSLKGYEKYLKGSLYTEDNIDDISLFNFYCKFYLDDEIDSSNDRITQSEINREKQLALNFINAYFAVKTMYIPLQIKKNLRTDFNKLSNMSQSYFILFLKGLKYGLVLQGVRVQEADKLIKEFLRVNGVSL